MSYEQGLDQEKLHIILPSLEKRFYEIQTFRGASGISFVFHNAKQSWQLKFNREFLEYIHSIGNLQVFLEGKVIPAILENPNRRIEVGSDGDITIVEKQP